MKHAIYKGKFCRLFFLSFSVLVEKSCLQSFTLVKARSIANYQFIFRFVLQFRYFRYLTVVFASF